MNVAAGLCHDAPDGVAPLADDVRVVSVGNVHLHGDAVALGLEKVKDARLGHFNAVLLSAHADVRV